MATRHVTKRPRRKCCDNSALRNAPVTTAPSYICAPKNAPKKISDTKIR